MTRFRYVMVTTVATLGIAFAGFVPTAPRLVWNASASVPIGFYTVAPDDRIAVPDLVAVIPPEPFASFMVERGYVARDVPLLKHVLGLPGQRLCRDGRAIIVDGVPLGEARDHDSFGRELPVWQGCRTLRAGELLMLNPDHADSMDGRYFGPLPPSTVLGRATPILTRDTPDAPLTWR